MFNQQLFAGFCKLRLQDLTFRGLLKIKCIFTVRRSLVLAALKQQLNGHLDLDMQPRAKRTVLN